MAVGRPEVDQEAIVNVTLGLNANGTLRGPASRQVGGGDIDSRVVIELNKEGALIITVEKAGRLSANRIFDNIQHIDRQIRLAQMQLPTYSRPSPRHSEDMTERELSHA